MGQTATAPDIRYASLAPDDIDAIMAVHLASLGAVGRPDLIKPESRDFFERILNGGGHVIGVFQNASFVGYGVLQFDLPPSEDARPQLGLVPGDRLAKLAGACVLPHAWGGGIHDALIELRVDEARRAGVPNLYATAAPGNARSWQNLLAAGFQVRALVEKYGGHARFILYRQEGLIPVADDGQWCAAENVQRQRGLLAQGWAGVRWRTREDGGRDICYVKPA